MSNDLDRAARRLVRDRKVTLAKRNGCEVALLTDNQDDAETLLAWLLRIVAYIPTDEELSRE